MTQEPHLLYVEDDPLSRQVMELVVKFSLGYTHFAIFEDSDNFMERLHSLPFKPTIVFLDIHVKPRSGLELLNMMRTDEDYHDVIAVAITASVMNDEIDVFKAAGFNAGMSKPIDQIFFPEFLSRVLAGEAIWHIQ